MKLLTAFYLASVTIMEVKYPSLIMMTGYIFQRIRFSLVTK